MIKGVIFDLDGVLVSTDEMHYKAWKRLAEEIGINNFTKEDNIRQRGVSRMESLEVLLSKGNRNYSPEEKEELAERKNDYYKELLQTLDDSVLLPGAVETLKKLKELNVMTAIGSASKNTPAILEKTGLAPYRDKVACGLDITRSKPDPEVFQVAAEKLGLQYGECMVVEDSAAGIQAAKSTEMRTLGVGPYYSELNADCKCRDLSCVKEWTEILR